MIKGSGYELILGSSLDPQFGPVLLFGLGGQQVEVFQDRALALPPLTTTLARRMMEQTRIFKALLGVRGRPPVDLEELERLMVRFSQLVTEQREIKEMDINPLLASHERLLALDARIVLHEGSAVIPRLAIRPYPRRYEFPWTGKNGETALIRPIRPEDEPLVVKFHQTLSDRSVYFRYLQMLNLSQRVAHERLIRICFNDYDREIALVAVREDEILGVGRLHKGRGSNDAEFALLISDAHQGKGLGTAIMNRLLDVARSEGVRKVTGDIHADNIAMQTIARKAGFKIKRAFGDPTVSVVMNLEP
jgi:acetyltransferase